MGLEYRAVNYNTKRYFDLGKGGLPCEKVKTTNFVNWILHKRPHFLEWDDERIKKVEDGISALGEDF